MCLGIPGQIVAISDQERNLGLTDFSGVRREVDLTCVATGELEALIGKWVLVHVGFAMSVINEEEAQLTLDALAQIGEAEEEMKAMRESAAMLEGKT